MKPITYVFGFLVLIGLFCGCVQAPRDFGLSDAEITDDVFVSLGMPPYDRNWTSADASQAAKVLLSVAKDDLRKLPHFANPGSGRVFSRITSTSNFEIYKDRWLPASERLPLLHEHRKAIFETISVYMGALEKHEANPDDFGEMIGLALGFSSVYLDTVFKLSFPSLAYPNRDEEYARRTEGMLEATDVGLLMLGSPSVSDGSKKRLMGYMMTNTPNIAAYMSPDTRAALVAKIKGLENMSTLVSYSKNLLELRTRIVAERSKYNSW